MTLMTLNIFLFLPRIKNRGFNGCFHCPVDVPISVSRIFFLLKLIVVRCCINTPHFSLLSSVASPKQLEKMFSDVPNIEFYAQYLYLIIDSLVMTTFFAILPQIFKCFSNSGSGATSIQEAERYALFYFWWFMVIWAFGGRTIGGTIITAFQDYDVTVERAQQIVLTLANNIPTSTSFRWIGWILLQTGMILPFMYFLQFNNFLFTALKLDCCARGTAGGGPGGVVPYRIYVNTGVIFLCVVALAPLCPVLAPVAMTSFLFISPLLKWSHIFVYRPLFDAGGMRW